MLSQPPAGRIHLMDSPFRSPRRTDVEPLVPVPLQSSDSSGLYGFPHDKSPALLKPEPFNFYKLFQ